MHFFSTKLAIICSLLTFSKPLFAEGIIDINPYVNGSFSYDDNIFRLSSSAKDNESGDSVKSVQVGVNVNLRLSRQLVNLAANISENKYNRYDILNNTGKSYLLGWNWRLGNDFYGVLSLTQTEAIAGFNEIRSASKNLRTTKRELASINWNFHPDYTIFLSGEQFKTENELANFNALDRKDAAFETGLRYENTLGTQLGLSYRNTQSNFLNRSVDQKAFFGDESQQQAFTLSAAWLASNKTRLSTRLSTIKIEFKDKPQRDINGLNQRWDINHLLTTKLSINATAYRDVAPIDDIISTFVKTTGTGVNASWALTSKVTIQGGFGYEKRDYLGSAGFFTTTDDDRNDESILANMSLRYLPTYKTTVQLQYQGEKRNSSIENQSFQFNNLNFIVRYDY